MSWEEFSKHNQKRGYDSDYISKITIMNMFASYGATDFVESKGNCCYDFLCTLPNGKRAAVECKDRAYPSINFDDHMCEKIKLDSLIKRKENGEFEKIFLVSIYSDSVIRITEDIDIVPYKLTQKLCPKETKLNDHSMIYKYVCIFT